MLLKKKISKDSLCLLLLYAIYLIALLVASAFTSPLYSNFYGDDSALFSMVGKGILNDKTLYIDLFDHKGPFIFFINAIGQMIGGYTGIFILQYIFGCISLTFLYYTAKMLLDSSTHLWQNLVLFSCAFAVFFYTFERGNLTEEYSQPFISCSLYFFVKYSVRTKDNYSHPPIYAFVYGISLAVLAFTRLNNAVTVCAGIAVIFVFLICKKEFKNVILNILSGCVGVAVVAVPTCLYFVKHSALNEMIYATFLYNFKIVGDSGNQSFFDYPIKFIVLYFPPVTCFVLWAFNIVIKKRKIALIDSLLGFILLLNFVVLILANRFPHYFTLFVPVYLVFLSRYFKFERKHLLTYLVAVCTAINLYCAGYSAAISVYSCYITKNPESTCQAVKEAVSVIPESERYSVIAYQTPVKYYIYADIIPCYKYYTWQESWSKINPEILTDFIEWVDSEKPLWVLTKPKEDHKRLLAILDQNYSVEFKNKVLVCYRLNEE